jgi:1,4-dihydroxy-2-naphthoate octaprenyltransferase
MPGEISRRTIWVDLLLYPGHTLPTAVAPVFVGAGLAWHDGVFAPLPLALAFVGSWLIHVGGVFTDNHELLRRHPGLEEHPELTTAVRSGDLRLGHLRLAIVACFLLGMLPGLYLLQLGGFPVIVIGVIGVLASFAYAGGGLAYARRGWADVIFFLMFGVVAVMGTYYIQAASHRGAASFWYGALAAVPLPAYLAGMPVGALVTNVMVIDDIRDTEFDRVKLWRTGPVRRGIAWSHRQFRGLMLFAYLFPLALWAWPGFSAWVLLPWLSAPLARRITATVTSATTVEQLRPMTPRMASLAMFYALLLAAGLAL